MSLSIGFLLLVLVLLLAFVYGVLTWPRALAVFLIWAALAGFEIYRATPAPQSIEGLTMRDYLASTMQPSFHSVQTFRRNEKHEPTVNELSKMLAEIRYIEADAMLAARELPPEHLTGIAAQVVDDDAAEKPREP